MALWQAHFAYRVDQEVWRVAAEHALKKHISPVLSVVRLE